MANAKAGNFATIDSTGTILSGKAIKVHSVTITTSNATNSLVLRDLVTTAALINLKLEVANRSETYAFDPPLFFPGGLEASTVTAVTATVVYSQVS